MSSQKWKGKRGTVLSKPLIEQNRYVLGYFEMLRRFLMVGLLKSAKDKCLTYFIIFVSCTGFLAKMQVLCCLRKSVEGWICVRALSALIGLNDQPYLGLTPIRVFSPCAELRWRSAGL